MKKNQKIVKFKIDQVTQLREMRCRDAEALYSLIDSNRFYLREWLPWVDIQQSVNDSLEFIEGSRKDNEQGRALTLCIEHESQLVGVIGFHEFDDANRSASLGYWITEGAQGKGIVTKSVRTLIDFAFSERGIDRVVLRMGTENTRSKKIAARLGAKFEDVSRQAEWLYDHYVDHEIHSIIVGDWN